MVARTENSPLGRARLDPATDVVAGSYTTWTVTYTVGELGLDDGGMVRLAWSQTSDMGAPQFDDPAAANYCRVETDGDARLEAEYDHRAHVRPKKHAVDVTVRDGALAPGEELTIRLGETGGGSPGVQAQSFPESGFVFRVLVDAHNTGEFTPLPEDLTVDIVPGARDGFVAVLPSTAAVDTEVSLSVRAEDYRGNVAAGCEESVQIDAPAGVNAPDRVSLESGTGTVPVRPTEPGIYRLRVSATDPDSIATSNPLICRASLDEHTYWGDLHGQSGETVGTGTVREYYQHLVESAFLDFGAHAANDFQLTDEVWSDITTAVREYHDPGDFVAFHCYEWSPTTPLGGDHNVYFRGDDPELHRSSHWQVDGADARHAGTHPIEELYDRFDDRDDVLIIPHQGGRPARLDALDPDVTPFIELVSVWGVFEWFARDAFERGYPVGLVGGSDDHSGRPGTAPPTNLAKHNVTGGLMAARAEQLGRDELWEAFTSRRVYATTGARILLDVTLAGARMGEEVSLEGTPECAVTVHGTAPLTAVDWFRGSDLIDTRDLTRGQERVELRWRGAGGKGRDKRLDWSGGVTLDRGRIIAAEDFGFDHPEDGLTDHRPDAVFWDAVTTGNHQGVRLRLVAPDDATLSVTTSPVSTNIPLADISVDDPVEMDGPGVDAGLTVARVGEATALDATVRFQDDDPPAGTSPYWIRVRQEDGNMAWSSPIFVTQV